MTDKQMEDQFYHIESQDQLLSPMLGSIDENQKCLTCGQYFPNCNGHVGYIKSFYYFNPLMQPIVTTILKHTCANCLNFDLSTTSVNDFCKKCQKKLSYFNISLIDEKVLGFIYATKSQVITLFSTLDITYKGFINTDNILHPLVIQKILEYQIINQPEEMASVCQSDSLLNVVHRCIPVVSYQFRVSQPEIGLINSLNIVYQKLFSQQYFIQEFETQQQNEYFLNFVDARQQNILTKYYITVYLLMGAYNNPQLEEALLLQNKNTNISLLQQATPKSGLFRGEMNAVRVNKSSRTVVTGNPYLDCDTLVCPKHIAENITVGVTVNKQNYEEIIKLINNYPKYPCAKYIISRLNTTKEVTYQYISQSNKDVLQTTLLPGDIVYRQIMDNDNCLTNRYPSIAEESFGCHKVQVRDIKSIQFNMSVVGKMTADFDGDEMQLFFYYTPRANTEAICLQSVSRQFVSYETGKNLIGGAKDLGDGIFNIQQNNDKLKVTPKGSTYIDLINKLIPKDLSIYDDGDVQIKDNKFIKFTKDIANDGSPFLTYVSIFYGKQYSLRFIDNVLKYCYKANEICGATLYPNVFNIYSPTYKSINKITQSQRTSQIQVIDDYYSGKFISPQGVDPKEYFEQFILAYQSNDQFIQQETLMENLKVEDPNYKGKEQIYNKILKKSFSDQMRQCCIYLGQRHNFDGTRITNPIRTLACFKKFDFKPETQGFIYNSFNKGMSATDSYYECIECRKQIYLKTNATPDVGYLSRRLSKGLDMVFVSYDGIVKNADGILSLNYGPGNYDPRNYIKYDLKEIFSKSEEELYKQYKDKEIVQLIQDLKDLRKRTIPYPDSKEEPYLLVPFQLQETISEKEAENCLTFNLTQKQSPLLQEAIAYRNLNIYYYLLLTQSINPKQKTQSKILPTLINSQCPPGESVGTKAGLSLGRPVTQMMLKAIHMKSGNGVKIVSLNELTGNDRLKSLIDHVQAPITFSAELLKGYNANDFVKKYSSYYFKELDPKLNYYLLNKIYTLEIYLRVSKLCYYDVDFKQLIDNFPIQYKTIDIQILDQSERSKIASKIQSDIYSNKTIKLTFEFQSDVLSEIKSLKNDFMIGLKYFQNLYWSDDNPEKVPRIYGNIEIPTILYKIVEINPDTIYISEPDIDTFGITYKQQALYNELQKCIASTSDISHVNKTHAYLMSQQLTYLGFYGSFGRNTYKKDDSRSLVQNVIYEEAQYFITDQLKYETYNDTKDFVSAQLFGTRCQQGVNISKIFIEEK